jgi:hypothetical protein
MGSIFRKKFVTGAELIGMEKSQPFFSAAVK